MRRLSSFATAVILAFFSASSAHSQGIVFDDSGIEILVGNADYYEIGFRKSNGSVAFIKDKTTGRDVTIGSRNECLWGAFFPDAAPPLQSYVGGCSFGAEGASQFSYSWSQATATLTLDYIFDPMATSQVSAQVVVTFSEEPWLDMRLELSNDWGVDAEDIIFPSDLLFVRADIEHVLLPILPGVLLESGFFQEGRCYTTKNPGAPGLFADYLSVSASSGTLTMYSLPDEGPYRLLDVGFIQDDHQCPPEAPSTAPNTYYRHAFGVRLPSGEMWESPTTRIRVSQSELETIRAYRLDNGLGQFPSLRQKAGSLYPTLVQAPLYKADAEHLNMRFSEYCDWLSPVPTPGILHPVAFQPDGHDMSSPDFLPPDAAWGTTEDFAAMFRCAQEQGFLVMPYINPTWWNTSPTLQDRLPPLTIEDVAAIDGQGAPRMDCFDNGMKCGYVMSPHSTFVNTRLDELMCSLVSDVPSDLVFEDQIGARPWIYDHNPSAPNPISYVEGWLEHTRTYSHHFLMTELGFDRLAETQLGFHGSVLWRELQPLPNGGGIATDNWWGASNWRPYPMAPIMLRDKVLFYQHDLAPETFTLSRAILTWNLAFGFMLSHDFSEPPFGNGGRDSDWLPVIAVFQRHVLSRYADELVTDFVDLQEGVTATSFEAYTTIANWNDTEPYDAGKHTLAPSGVQVTAMDGTLTAGVFSHYNDERLSENAHYLVEERGSDAIEVHQPLGGDTALTLELLDGWDIASSIKAFAHDAAGGVIGAVPTAVTATSVTFFYQQNLEGEAVAFYRITDSGCAATSTALCLNGERFKVEVFWKDFNGNEGQGQVYDCGTPDSGLFWFFDADNWEVMVKVLDGCPINDHVWVFAAATTNVEYTIRVTDGETGQMKEYSNPLGTSAAAITDTLAFSACGRKPVGTREKARPKSR